MRPARRAGRCDRGTVRVRQLYRNVCPGTEWGMLGVELRTAFRLAVVDEDLRHHEAGRRFGIGRWGPSHPDSSRRLAKAVR